MVVVAEKYRGFEKKEEVVDEKAVKAGVESRIKETDSLLGGGDHLGALRKALTDLPPNTKDSDVKKKSS